MHRTHLSIGTRLFLTFFLLLVIFLSGLFIISVSMETVEVQTTRIKEKDVPMALLSEQMVSATIEFQQWVTDISLTLEGGHMKEVHAAASVFHNGLSRLRHQAQLEGDQATIMELSSLERAFEEFSETGYNMIRLYQEEGRDAGNRLMDRFDLFSDALKVKITALRTFHVDREEKSAEKMLSAVNQAKNVLLLVSIFGTLAGLSIALYFTRLLSRRVVALTRRAELIARGGSPGASTEEGQKWYDEIDTLSQALHQIDATFTQLADKAVSIARGNLETRIAPRSDIDEMGHALGAMTDSLRQAAADNQTQMRMAKGRNGLHEAMLGEVEIPHMASAVASFLARFTGASACAVYLVKQPGNGNGYDGDELVLAGGFALPRSMQTRFAIGTGLVGQAAVGGKPLFVSELSQEHWRLHSGLGDSLPRHLVLFPVLNGHDLIGVVELALNGTLGQTELNFLSDIAPHVAIGFSAAMAHARLGELLQHSQAQAEELQAQAAELESQQEELEGANRQLELQTADIHEAHRQSEERNERLTVVQRELESHVLQLKDANRYKMEFLANMSHELRTPLNSILVLSKLFINGEAGGLTEEQEKYAQVIHSSGSDLLTLINELLDLSKIEAGQMPIHLSQVRLADLPGHFQESFSAQMKDAGLTFSCHIEPGVPDVVHTDSTRLMQVIRNFLGNAVKFTERGSVTFTIQPYSSDIPASYWMPGTLRKRIAGQAAEDYVVFAVSDTGIGIPNDQLGVVFEAFQQVDGAIDRKFGGTGLGMSISLKIAENLKGGLAVKSEPGVGSTFLLILPREAVWTGAPQVRKKGETPRPGMAVQAPAGATDAQAPAGAGVTKERVLLIVEDDERFAATVAALAEKKGFKPLIAKSGSEGLRMAFSHRPDAILLDIHLPVMNGWEVLKQLKSNPETRHIPVHVVSGDDDSQLGYRLGAMQYLLKPVDPEQLETIFKLLAEGAKSRMRRLLLVADEGKRQEMTQLIGGGGDVEILSAENGQEALDILTRETVDCLVLEPRLPDMEGVEVLERIHLDTRLQRIPTVVCVDEDLDADEESRLRRYADRVILKSAESRSRLLEETAIFLHRVHNELSAQQRRLLAELSPPEAMYQGKRVLVVDDDVRNTYSLTVALENKGLTVLTAVHGQEALEVLEQEGDGVDFVLMDLMMPVMDGFTAIARIREQERFKDLPIIAVTAKAMREDREASMRAGASDYLTKPIDYDQLFSLIRVWLSVAMAL